MRLAAFVALAVCLAFPIVSSGAQDADKVYTPGKEGVTPPVVVKEVKPKYPQAALKEGKSAVVEVECVVTKAGVPTDVRVLNPDDPAFDYEAVKALKQWEFKPGTKDGKPVPVRVQVELTFTAKK
jgi:TonB family protein